MKRHSAVKSVGDAILKDGLAKALFLKGSIARGDDDEYSDVDMYAVVSKENHETFLSKRIEYLEAYKPLIYWSESNFVGPQIVGVFENALHFDLYMVTPGAIPQTDDIKVLYDKNGLLKSYRKVPLSISHSEAVTKINGFSFTLLEFEAAYMRKDLMWAIRLFYALLADASFLSRYIYDRDSSQLGLKRLHKVIPVELYVKYSSILENATPTNVLVAVKMLVELTDEMIQLLPDEIQNKANRKFFEMMKGKIAAIE